MDQSQAVSPPEEHHRSVEIVTGTNAEKGWWWAVCYGGERLARSQHHVPLEVIALRQAAQAALRLLIARLERDASSIEIIRADRWEADARLQSALAGAVGGPSPKTWPVPVRLSCGHVRMVKPSTQLGSDQVACGPCACHRVPTEWIDSGPPGPVDERTANGPDDGD